MHVTRNQVKISADLPDADILVLNSKRGSRSALEIRSVRRDEIAVLTCIRIKGKMRRHEEYEDIPATMHYNGINLQKKKKKVNVCITSIVTQHEYIYRRNNLFVLLLHLKNIKWLPFLILFIL